MNETLLNIKLWVFLHRQFSGGYL